VSVVSGVLTVCMAAVGLGLVCLQAFSIGTWCTLCLVVAGCSFVLMGMSWGELMRALRHVREAHARGETLWESLVHG
jgi:predicted small metal-binding protein